MNERQKEKDLNPARLKSPLLIKATKLYQKHHKLSI